MLTRRWFFCALSCVSLLACDASAGPAISGLAAQVARDIIAPKFSRLEEAFKTQAMAWDAGCATPETLRNAYHAAYDAWAQAEFFRSGPLAQQTRAERIDYWPDPRNFIDKGLRALLAAPTVEEMTPERIADSSVAVQGLPAIERLLFDAEGAKPVLDQRTCAAGRAIAQNLASVATALNAAWNDVPTGEAHRLAGLAGDDAKTREAAVALLTDLATGIRVIEDRKLPPLFGTTANSAGARAAKSWRSGRSEKDLQSNLASMIEAYASLNAFAPQGSAAVVEKLKDAQTALANKEDPNRAIAVLAAMNNAKYYAVDVLPGEMGLTLGFNSLDGD